MPKSRTLRLLAILLVSLVPASASLWAEPQWRVIETLSYNWYGDSRQYEFLLRAPTGYDGPGDYTQLQINLGGQLVFTVTDGDGLVRYKDALVGEGVHALRESNLLRSGHLLMLPAAKDVARKPVVVLFGYSYASSPGSVHIIALSSEGVPTEVLSLANFTLTAHTDLNGDGIYEVVGKECFSQTSGAGILTYDPYSVYCFGTQASSRMALDLALSKRYNEDHYAGWAGIKCREDIGVRLSPPGGRKSIIVDPATGKPLQK